VYYAAIGSGILALLVVIAFFVYLYKRRNAPLPNQNYTTSPFPTGTPKTTASSTGGGFLGYPPSPSNRNHSHSRRIGSVDDSPTSAGRLKKVNSDRTRNPYQHNPISPRRKEIPVMEEEGSEMVMVTYEEGLRKLGLDKPQYTIYPDPPSWDTSGDIKLTSITPPFSSYSSRPTPTTADLLTPGKTGLQGQGFQHDQSRSPLNTKYVYTPSPTRSPRSPPTPRVNLGRDEGRFPTDSELMTTGIPSYYHEDSGGRYRLESPTRSP